MTDTIAVFDLDSATDALNAGRSQLQINVYPALELPAGQRFKLRFVAGCPFTIHNISAARGNNTLRYTTDNTAEPIVWKTVTLPDGLYTTAAITAAVRHYLEENSDYIAGDSSFTNKYLFDIGFNNVTGLCYIIFDDTETDEVPAYDTTTLDLTNNGASSLHLLLGFADVENAVELTGERYQYSEQQVDLMGTLGELRIYCDLIESFGRDGRSDLMYKTIWNSAPYSPCLLPYSSVEQYYLPLAKRVIGQINVRFCDSTGTPLYFTGAESKDNKVWCRLIISE